MTGVVAAGFFDGVHAGHRLILEGADCALTFRNHPDSVLCPQSRPPLLMPFEARVAAIRALGVKEVVALDFTRELADTPAAEFASVFAGASEVRCGGNWRFGRGGEGDAAFLRARGLDVRVVPYATYGGRPVSSTRIREALAAGRMEDAAAMLGRPWSAEGVAARGKGLGAKIGFATLNLLPPEDAPRLPFGAYEVEALGERAVANWGVAPTAGDGAWKSPVLEVHFRAAPPRAADGGRVAVSFLRFLRPERRFPDFAALAAQVAEDCREVFGGGWSNA